MNITLTEKEIVELYNGIDTLPKLEKVKSRLLYAASRTRSKIAEFAEAVLFALKPSPKFTEYDNKRLELAKKHAKKAEKGLETRISGGVEHYVLEDPEAFAEAVKALQEEYKEAIEIREKTIAEIEEKLKETRQVEVFVVPFDQFPEEMSGALFNALKPLIEEPQTK